MSRAHQYANITAEGRFHGRALSYIREIQYHHKAEMTLAAILKC